MLTDNEMQLLIQEYETHKVMALLGQCGITEDMIMEAYKANDLLQPVIHDGTYYFVELKDDLKIIVQVESLSEWGKEDLKWYRQYRKSNKKSYRKKVTKQQLFEAMRIVVKLLAYFDTNNKLIRNWIHQSDQYYGSDILEHECMLFPYAKEEMFLIKKCDPRSLNDDTGDYTAGLLDLG